MPEPTLLDNQVFSENRGVRYRTPKQNQQSHSFASILDAMMHIEDPDNEHGFDAFA